MRATAVAALLFAGCGAAARPADDGALLDADVDGADVDGARDLHLAEPPIDLASPRDGVPDDGGEGCQSGMARIENFCVDRWEAYVVELDDAGTESPHSPYRVVDGLKVRAKVAAGIVPQGYISQVQATAACSSAGKRLCTAAEFALACRGDDPANDYPYGGKKLIKGYCNQDKGSSVARFFGNDPFKWSYANFNDPKLNQWDGGLAPSGSYPHCVSPHGVFDCVGNLHEWGADRADAEGHGRFRGGFYGDAEYNGPGCLYVTSAHELTYHDYSTGFRCCSNAL